MRQIRTSGSEGGETAIKAVFPTPIRSGLRPMRLVLWHGHSCLSGERRNGGAICVLPTGRKFFTEAMARGGFEADRKHDGRGWNGAELRPEFSSSLA